MRLIVTFLAVLISLAVHASDNAYSVESAIYKIEVPYPDGSRTGLGTGVLVASDKILTNCHVLTAHPGWPVAVHRKTGQRFNVTQHYNLGSFDACVLVGRFAGTPIKLSRSIDYGEPVWVYGYPRGMTVVSQGNLISLVDVDVGKVIKSAVFCDQGSSGGPLINRKGELIGLNFGVIQYQDQCLSIPAFFLMPYLGM